MQQQEVLSRPKRRLHLLHLGLLRMWDAALHLGNLSHRLWGSGPRGLPQRVRGLFRKSLPRCRHRTGNLLNHPLLHGSLQSEDLGCKRFPTH